MNVAFKTVGCRLNQAETAAMRAGFEAAGYQTVESVLRADVVVIHTCAITDTAERNCIRISRSAKRRQPPPIVVLAGCAVQVSHPRLLQNAAADLLVGQKDKYNIPALIAARHRAAPLLAPPDSARRAPRFTTTRAIIKAQDGCDFRCAYCVVPAARGAPSSRPLTDIIEEVRRVTGQGFREVVLTGANLGCYSDGRNTLVHLVREVESIPSVSRIRLSSIELSTVERNIIDHMAESAKLCRHLHIPLQSGDDRTLAAMGRRYTARQYQQAVEYALARMPLLGLGTDLIMGFPGEDQASFENTLRLVRGIPFSNLHVFPYSARPGTRAAGLPGQVPDREKKRRSAALLTLGKEKRAAFAAQFIGRPVTVLLENPASPRHGHGWTGEYIESEVAGNNLYPNQLVTFRPESLSGTTLIGRVDPASGA